MIRRRTTMRASGRRTANWLLALPTFYQRHDLTPLCSDHHKIASSSQFGVTRRSESLFSEPSYSTCCIQPLILLLGLLTCFVQDF